MRVETTGRALAAASTILSRVPEPESSAPTAAEEPEPKPKANGSLSNRLFALAFDRAVGGPCCSNSVGKAHLVTSCVLAVVAVIDPGATFRRPPAQPDRRTPVWPHCGNPSPHGNVR